MEDYFEGFSEEITRWEIIREIAEFDKAEKRVDNKNESSVQLLRRQDVMLYGTIPKMEQRVYSKCRECRLVFNPRNVLLHKSCVGKDIATPTPCLKKRVKSKSKKSHSHSSSSHIFKKPYPPPPLKLIGITTSTDKKLPTSSSTSIKESSEYSAPIIKSPEVLLAKKIESSLSNLDSTTSLASDSIFNPPLSQSEPSTRHSKSRGKGGNKVCKEYDPDVHCGVVEGSKGPCTRSITCTNHKIQLKKSVPGRSKDIHQLIAERKAAKEKDLKNSSNFSHLHPSENIDEKETFCQNTSCVPIVATIASTIEIESASASTYVPTQSNCEHSTSINDISTSLSITKPINSAKSVMIDLTSEDIENGYNCQNSLQESIVGTVPVIYMPMSPISVSPVQFVQIGEKMICLESPQSAMNPPLPSQSVLVPIPDQRSNVTVYKTHPKPIFFPRFGARRIGSSILLTTHRLEYQRHDILLAINTRRKTTHNFTSVSVTNNTPHRPNILKGKSANKVNTKRASVEKLNISDSKIMRLTPDVNGFILHADMSESADAPQPNHCFQEKLTLLNMK